MNLIDLAHDELRKEIEAAKSHSESQEVREFKEAVGALLPWHRLWAATFVNKTSSVDLATVIAEAQATSRKAEGYSYREESNTTDEIATVWFDTLLSAENADAALFDAFDQWIVGLKRPLFTPTLTRMARLAARSPAQEARALDFAGKSYERFCGEREDAKSKSDGYVELARAVLTVSRSEAACYFNQAVEVASKIGDENLDRWGALLDLAERAASRNRPAPEIAYRLARCAELTYEYVVRDKHFDWDSTVKAISGLCGKSSLAIISRWRDRDFGWAEKVLPIAVNFLVDRGDLDSKLALALIGFSAQWDNPSLLKRVLADCNNKAEKDIATKFIYRYMTLEPQSADRWRRLKAVLVEHDIAFTELDERIHFCEREEQSRESRENDSVENRPSVWERKDKRDWNIVFEGIDLTNANDISLAHQRFKGFEPPLYHEDFFKEAYRRVKIGQEAEFITAIADITAFDLYHLRYLLEQIPENWKNRHSVKPALARTVKTFCRRFCMGITRNRYYEMLPFETAYELSGMSEGEMVDVVLGAIGEATEVVGAGRLFSLVGLLAAKLTENEALDALSFGLDLFDVVLEETDGDGPWSPKLAPPADIETSVAGYIWACLAAPQASLRWEAAHVVRALCTFGQVKTLAHLVGLANGSSLNVFFDAHLHFYDLHGRQWLLIGLARAAKERPDLIAPHIGFLKELTFAGEPHVLIREFAKRTILTLFDAGVLAENDDLRQRLASVNISPFPPVESKPYRRSERSLGPDSEVDRFSFGIDMGPNWFAPLGECFAMSQAAIERLALRVIRVDWKFFGGTRWDEDERHRRKLFKDGNTRHSHGSYPRVDDLRFYYSYHAMMVVAGKLLATTPVHRDPDYPKDDFRDWLRGHDLSRRDGAWLADRRDPPPLERPAWQDEKETNEWRWSIERNDFDRILMPPDGRMNLWGHWTRISGQREESIQVASALVSSVRSTALLRALHSVANPHDYRIPDADDGLQIDFDGFQLKGWIIDRSHDSRLDEQDPWAGAIRYLPPRPAPYVAELMNLKSDTERRHWFVQGEQVDVAWSQVWGHFHEKDHDEAKHESGTRFQASFTFIVSFLRKLGMDLIVKVEIERHHRHFQWEGSKDDNLGYIPASARLFLIKSDGSISTL